MENNPKSRISGQTTDTMTGESSSWQTQLNRPLETVEQVVRNKPVETTLAVFGVGLGLGVMVGCLLADQAGQRRQLANSLGTRMLDSISGYMPDTIQQRLRS